ncbi:hypothetical protein [Primorskyibacter sp. S187A]|uniref:hypothetical protein n=1 Tax=Primorskyibacter sp. S187A TaxID=3415130 RepID=UPI003C7E91F5
MSVFFTRVISLVLSVTLLLTAETMAMARGATAAVDEIILCTGHGPSSVYVDSDGEPTSAPHICPDCALFFAAVSGASPDAALVEVLVTLGFAPETVDATPADPRIAQRARAPPVIL